MTEFESFRAKLKSPAGGLLSLIVISGTLFFAHRLYFRDKWKRERSETNKKYADIIYENIKQQENENQQQTFS